MAKNLTSTAAAAAVAALAAANGTDSAVGLLDAPAPAAKPVDSVKPARAPRKPRKQPKGQEAPVDQKADTLTKQDDGEKKDQTVVAAQLAMLADVRAKDLLPNDVKDDALKNAITQAAKMVLVGFGLSAKSTWNETRIGYGEYARRAVVQCMLEKHNSKQDKARKTLPEAEINYKFVESVLLADDFQTHAAELVQKYVDNLDTDGVSATTIETRTKNMGMAKAWLNAGLFKDLLTSLRWLRDLGNTVKYGDDVFTLDTALRIALGRSLTASKLSKNEFAAMEARAAAAKNAN